MWTTIVTLLFIICATIGYRKGVVEIVVGLTAGIIAMILVAVISPLLSQVIIDNTSIDEGIGQAFVEHILSNEDVTYTVGEKVEVYDEVQAVMDIQLPHALQEKILENNTTQMYIDLGVSNFYEYVGSYIARWIIRVVTFVITLIVVLLFMKIFVFSILVIANVPLLGSVNKIGGLLVGLLGAIVILWLMFIVADLLHQMEWASEFVYEVTQYKFFEIIYRENPIMGLLFR